MCCAQLYLTEIGSEVSLTQKHKKGKGLLHVLLEALFIHVPSLLHFFSIKPDLHAPDVSQILVERVHLRRFACGKGGAVGQKRGVTVVQSRRALSYEVFHLYEMNKWLVLIFSAVSSSFSSLEKLTSLLLIRSTPPDST